MKVAIQKVITLLLVFSALSLTSLSVNAGLDYCWKNTYGRGVGTIPPAKCAKNQEMQGKAPFFTCYNKCPSGYDSTALGGCMQKCPTATYRDTFGNCVDNGAKKRYKNIEFTTFRNPDRCTIFSKGGLEGCFWNSCKKRHGSKGCEKYGAAIVAKCKTGYKRALLHCIPDLSCNGYKGKGVDFFGKTFCETKRLAPRPPRPADCGNGKENDAGLCYKKCGKDYDGVGPVCWNKCPKIRGKQWVECGAGCAENATSCGLNTADMVVSVLDSAISIASLGSASGGIKAISKGAKKGITSGIKAAAKQYGKNFTNTFVKGWGKAASAAKKAGVVASKVKDGASYAYYAGGVGRNVKGFAGAIQEIVGKDISQEEMDFQITQQVLSNASILDPSGVLGVVAAYTKPLCSVISKGAKEAPGDYVDPNTGKAATAGAAEAILSNQKDLTGITKLRIKAVKNEIKDLKAQLKPKHKKALPPSVMSGFKKEISLKGNELKALNKRLKTIDGSKKAVKPVAKPKRHVPKRHVPKGNKPVKVTKLRWAKVSGAAVDVGVSDGNGSTWVVNRAGTIFQYQKSKWIKKPGKATRISVSYYGNPWVVNKSGQVWRWSKNKWNNVAGLKAKDIAVSKKIWAIGSQKVSGGYTIHEYDDRKKKWMKRPGGAVKIAVSQWGNPWVVNSTGNVFRWIRGKWHSVAGVKAKDIGIGADGIVWVTTNKQKIFYTKKGKKWLQSSGGAVTIDVGSTGKPWVLNSKQQIWQAK